MTIHAKCGATWGGVTTAHCAGCCVTFSGLTAFDAHRKGGTCITPAEAKLVQTGRDYPCFGYPSTGSEWWKDGAA